MRDFDSDSDTDDDNSIICKLSIDFRNAYDNAAHSDITIRFGDRSIRAHRVILCAASPYFKAMLNDAEFAEGGQADVELHADHSESLERCIKHIYGYEHSIDCDSVEGYVTSLRLAQVADKYLVSRLANQIFNHLRKSFECGWPQNFLEVTIDLVRYLRAHEEDFIPRVWDLVYEGLSRFPPSLLRNKGFKLLLKEDLVFAGMFIQRCPAQLVTIDGQEPSAGIARLLPSILDANESQYAVQLVQIVVEHLEDEYKHRVTEEGVRQINYVGTILQDENGRALYENNKSLCIDTILKYFRFKSKTGVKDHTDSTDSSDGDDTFT